MLDYGTHQILHKHRERELIAQSQHDALVQVARADRRWRIRLPVGEMVLRVLGYAARRAATGEARQIQPEPCLQGAGE